MCHLAVYLPLKKWSYYFNVILCNSQWFKSPWNYSGVILGDSQWSVNHSEMILGLFSVIHKSLWNDFGVILGDSSDLWWFVNHSEMILEQIMVNFNDSQAILKWLMNHWDSPPCILINHTWWERGCVLNRIESQQSLINHAFVNCALKYDSTSLNLFNVNFILSYLITTCVTSVLMFLASWKIILNVDHFEAG